MAKPVIIETGDSPEPDRDAQYRDRAGEYWWYGKDMDGDVGWVWGPAPQPQGTPSLECEFARTWGTDALSDLPWRLVVLRSEDEFTVKDSGVREEYANGFVRDTEDGKYDYARVLQIEGLHLIPIEALERWGAHMVKGAAKYGEDNWRQAQGPVAIARFIRSLCRHTVQFIRKDRTEDHAAAVCFNVWAAELTPEEE